MTRVALSNGFGQFHLLRLAELLHERGNLAQLITAAYPLSEKKFLSARRFAAVQRFYERRVSVPTGLIRTSWKPEIVHQLAQRTESRRPGTLADALSTTAFSLYQEWASEVLAGRANFDIYHYRAGLGGSSLSAVPDVPQLCDHSIAHPRVLETLLSTPGLSEKGFWRQVTSDVDQAQALLVNSEFVRDTCIRAGIDHERIFVAYTAVDPIFREASQIVARADRFQEATALFAGTVERRKGADTYLDAAAHAPPGWPIEWQCVGSWQIDMHAYRHVNSPVQFEAKLPRLRLAERLRNTSVFVFPSRAEGSARIVGEAMAAGCYVITTANAGSLVRDGIDGRIIPHGSADKLLEAVQEYLSLSEDERRLRSQRTQSFADERLSEERYVSDVVDAYDALLGS